MCRGGSKVRYYVVTSNYYPVRACTAARAHKKFVPNKKGM
jgi:hypothetical protein